MSTHGMPHSWPAARQASTLSALMAFSLLVLMGMTWPLWTPQTVFPQVPLLGLALGWPTSIGWVALTGMLTSAASLLALSQWQRWPPQATVRQGASLLLFSCFGLLVLIDQHRLQPWAYQLVAGLLLLSCLPAPSGLRWCRGLVLSIYAWSALSKFDLTFLESTGQRLLSGLLRASGNPFGVWPPSVRLAVVASFPLAELALAWGLARRKTRPLALPLSVAMHLTLLLALGPWGLDQHRAVLGWNVYFILQNLVLFGPMPKRRDFGRLNFGRWEPEGDLELAEPNRTPAGQPQADRTPGRQTRIARLVTGAALFMLLAPALEPFGYYDHWPAWGLYSVSHDRIILFVSGRAKGHLPRSVRPFLEAPQAGKPWCRLRTDRWSLATLKAPLYPQARFQLGVAEAVGGQLRQAGGGPAQYPLRQPPAIRVVLEGRPNRYTGKRQMRAVEGLAKIRALASRYWLNAHPHPDVSNFEMERRHGPQHGKWSNSAGIQSFFDRTFFQPNS